MTIEKVTFIFSMVNCDSVTLFVTINRRTMIHIFRSPAKKMQTQSKSTGPTNFMNLFFSQVSKFDEFQSLNIINIPLLVLVNSCLFIPRTIRYSCNSPRSQQSTSFPSCSKEVRDGI